jgi:NAD(P)-dependent dehydrogenase (short-subunit alcohol dehydrogenase family)
MRIDGKVVLITGASEGIGAACAREFATSGAKLSLTARNEEGLRRAAASDSLITSADITVDQDRHRVVDRTLERFGAIDILINNAGVSGSDPDRLSMATWDRQMSINAKGVFLGMRAVIPVMQKAKSGSIVNTSSISGVVGQTFVHMGYNASKGAVRTMSKAAAVQFARDGIRINSVHPGLMPAMRTSVMSADPTVRAAMLKAIPMRREGKVDEVANANLFLASDEASYITGVELPVDGGFLAM